MKPLLAVSLTLLAVAAFSPPGGAAPSQPSAEAEAQATPSPARPPVWGPPRLSEFDGDGDGRLTEQEFYEGRARRMAERAQQGGQMRNAANAPTFTQVDTNGDGFITQEEFAAHQATHRQGRGR